MKYSRQELTGLTAHSSAYMAGIDKFASSICSSPIQQILECLIDVREMMEDNTLPPIRKLTLLRFIKDCLLLASLGFYQCTVIQVLPWIVSVVKAGVGKGGEGKTLAIGRLLRGGQAPNGELVVLKSLGQLAQQVLKWFGTNVRVHPLSNLEFRSAFKIYLDTFLGVGNLKMNELSFFKSDDNKRYESYYLERESSERHEQEVDLFVAEKIKSIKNGDPIAREILQRFVETGDGWFIKACLEELEQNLEECLNRKKQKTGIMLIQFLHSLMLVGDVQFCYEAVSNFLEKILLFVQISYKQNFRTASGQDQTSRIVAMIRRWKIQCDALPLKRVFEQVETVLKRQHVVCEKCQQIEKQRYTGKLDITGEINKDKLKILKMESQDNLCLRIRNTKYIPFYQSKIPSEEERLLKQSAYIINISEKNKKEEIVHKGQDQADPYVNSILNYLSSLKVIKSDSNKSHQSSESHTKRQFLQAYSKYPQRQNQLKNNVSEVKQIELQHSNLSERFNQPIKNDKNLIISFKRFQKGNEEGQSPRLTIQKSADMVFSDSFASNQKISIHQMKSSQNKPLHFDFVKQKSISSRQQGNLPIQGSFVSNSQFQSGAKNSHYNSKESGQFKNYNIYNDYEIPLSRGSRSFKRSQNKNSRLQQLSSARESSKVRKRQEKSSSLYKIKSSKSIKSVRYRQQPNSHTSQQHSGQVFSNSRGQSKPNGQIKSDPFSRISNSRQKNINILQFSEQEYYASQKDKVWPVQLTEHPKAKDQPAIQPIRVEKTLRKPKFGFTQSNKLEKSISVTQRPYDASDLGSISESISLEPTVMEASMGTIPQNFKQVLKVSGSNGLRVNQFVWKVKQLQVKIQKEKQKKQRVIVQIEEKQSQIGLLRKRMPPRQEEIIEQNKRLRKAIKTKRGESQKIADNGTSYRYLGSPIHVHAKVIARDLKKQMVYSKSLLLRNNKMEIGFQIKQQGQLCFYFTFLQDIDQCDIRLQEGSLQLKQELSTKIYNIPQGKQLKFKLKIQGYTLYHYEFQIAKLITTILSSKPNQKDKKCQVYQIKVPFLMYNALTFHPSIRAIRLPKATDWHYCCKELLSGYVEYLRELFGKGDMDGSRGFKIGISNAIYQEKEQLNFSIVVQGEKFLIQFEGKNMEEQLPILNCLISVLELENDNPT